MDTDTKGESFATTIFDTNKMSEQDKNTLLGMQRMNNTTRNGLGIYSINTQDKENPNLIRVKYNPKGTQEIGFSGAQINKGTLTLNKNKSDLVGINLITEQMESEVKNQQQRTQRTQNQQNK